MLIVCLLCKFSKKATITKLICAKKQKFRRNNILYSDKMLIFAEDCCISA